ncbi:dual specificity protein phosphatase 1-like [Punica granatum]|uniref:Dual specificity protein phosphatase 1-like n=1 Tax=Punica granatum TaxID=22663 RepID=A0A218WAE3_PUNGR|nr:dual specificity protein phosphatase 1-like [Punica granatum]XP_031383568.1 dual specificity protein phosphatase 1-like [Punica granatum]XP_031383569.1 dual specificity protein phosphatase 1-like [Punica granatum]OWM69847.1 hypothetical protein CDL15_Pgr025696 [Punica granatum]
MAHTEDYMRRQIAAILQLRSLTKCIKEDRVPCQIEEGLFLGSVGAANNKDEVKRLNITHILVVAKSIGPAYPTEFVYKVIEVTDKEDVNIRQHFDECCEFINEAKSQGGGVLVHCFMGRSRSVSVVVAYLMKKHGMSLSQAMEHVKSKRPQASPNSGFLSQLQEYEKSLGTA